MGVYDSFKCQRILYCPYCGKNFKDEYVQSKSFGSDLYNYKVGDIIEWCKDNDIPNMIVGVFLYHWNDECDKIRKEIKELKSKDIYTQFEKFISEMVKKHVK